MRKSLVLLVRPDGFEPPTTAFEATVPPLKHQELCASPRQYVRTGRNVRLLPFSSQVCHMLLATRWLDVGHFGLEPIVESRCGAVAVGSSQLLPPLSVGGAAIKVP
jgi:hypothetical protein